MGSAEEESEDPPSSKLKCCSAVRKDAVQSSFLSGAASGTSIGTVNYSFGVFVPEISNAFPDWSRTDINVAFSISQIVSSLAAPISGFMMDKYSVRLVVAISLFLMAVGFVLLSQTQSLPLYYFAYFLIGVGFPAPALLQSGKVVGEWFTGPKRGRVMGLVAASNNLGGLIYTQISTAIILASNFRWAAASYAIIIIALSVIYYFGIRFPDSKPAKVEEEHRKTIQLEDENTQKLEESQEESKVERNADMLVDIQRDEKVENEKDSNCENQNESVTVKEHDSLKRVILMSPKFFCLTLGFVCAYWTYSGVLSNIFPAVIAEGFSEIEAANIQSAVAISGIISKLACGVISERLTARITLMSVMCIQACSLVLFAIIKTPGSVWYWVSCVLYGLSFGGVGALLPLTALENFGQKNFSKYYGFQNGAFVLAALIAPIAAGISFDDTESYANAFLGAAAVFVTGAFLLFLSGKMDFPDIVPRESSRDTVDP